MMSVEAILLNETEFKAVHASVYRQNILDFY